MKKFLAGIAAAAIITVPMTSFALESMSKGALKKATGQAGVSIALDNVVIYQTSAPKTTYWDNDGTSVYHGTVGMATRTGVEISYAANSEKLIILDAILDDTNYGQSVLAGKFNRDINGDGDMTDALENIGSAGIVASGSGAATASATGPIIDASTGDTIVGATGVDASGNPIISFQPSNTGLGSGISPLTIDVGTCQALTYGMAWNAGVPAAAALSTAAVNVVGVVIGLPTVEITQFYNHNEKTIKVVTGTGTGMATAANGNEELISIEKAGVSKMAILGGRLEIAPH